MIKIYFKSTDASSRKAIQWLKNQNLKYEKINWAKEEMTQKDFMKILSLSEKGTQDILAKKSDAYLYLSQYIDDLLLIEVLELLNCQKSLLRLPVLMDDRHLQIGYNTDNIRQFIPKNVRKLQMETLYKTGMI